jgi:hypothetical protein
MAPRARQHGSPTISTSRGWYAGPKLPTLRGGRYAAIASTAREI